MIDAGDEQLIALNEVPDIQWLPERRGGSRLSARTVRAWARKGVRGVKLEVTQIGGATCTTESAILRFFERLSAPRLRTDARPQSEAQALAATLLDVAGI